MAHNTNRKSQGLCQKFHRAVSPLRSRIRRLSHQPQGSISITNDGKPAHVLHQSSLSKMIPVEFNHLSAENTKKLIALSSPVVQPAGKENTNISSKVVVQDSGDREILVVRGQKFANTAPPVEVEKGAPTEGKQPSNHARFAKVRSKKDDHPIHEGKFSDYISKVKNRMMRTASNVGGGGGGGDGHVEKTLSLK